MAESITAEDFLPSTWVPGARLVPDAELRNLLAELEAARAALKEADLAALSALSRAGIPTPAEGFVKAGWGWLQSAILELGYRTAKCARCVTPPLPSETTDSKRYGDVRGTYADKSGTFAEAPIPFTLTAPSDPSDLELTSDQANAIEEVYAVAREARFVLGGGRQDRKLIQECAELIRALQQRDSGYQDGGKRGDVDDELADVLHLVLGAMGPEAEAWKVLREKKLPHVRALIAGVKGG